LNAGLINFRQAATLIIGSNIGTVITGFIIGIKISNYSLLFVALGMFLRMMGKNKIRKEYGRAVFGFGILFFGMNLMGESMYPLKESEYFNHILLTMEENPFIGLLAAHSLLHLFNQQRDGGYPAGNVLSRCNKFKSIDPILLGQL
jgi:phosphate:Na+ symporter